MDHKKRNILVRLAAGALSVAEAEVLLKQASKRGPKPKAKPPKKANGRPHNLEQRELIFGYWVMFHDKMPKQRLKEILSDALEVDISIIDKRIAEINSVARNPNILILRNDEGRVLAGTRIELRRAIIREKRMRENAVSLLHYEATILMGDNDSDTAKTPSN